jgi:pyruvate dehydrogenase E2 component (dihydrolipoamide acetyltransferase)
MYGVERFTAVLNPPQAGILAVGAIEERAVVVDGDFEIQPRMDMTLTIDHRSVDGATASEFLATVKSFLEQPGLAL